MIKKHKKTDWKERKKDYIKDRYKTILNNSLASEIYKKLLITAHNPETYNNPDNLKTKAKKKKGISSPTPQLKTYFSAWTELGYLDVVKKEIETNRKNKFTKVYFANITPFFDYLNSEGKLDKNELDLIKKICLSDATNENKQIDNFWGYKTKTFLDSVKESITQNINKHVFTIMLEWLYFEFHSLIKWQYTHNKYFFDANKDAKKMIFSIIKKLYFINTTKQIEDIDRLAYLEDKIIKDSTKNSFNLLKGMTKAKLTEKQQKIMIKEYYNISEDEYKINAFSLQPL